MKKEGSQYQFRNEGISRRRFLQLSACGTAGLAIGAGKVTLAKEKIESNPPNRPNIVLITTDEQRYDTLGSAGNKAIRTPNLDRMANQGVRFSRTYCQSPLCQPSRASLITDRYVHEHGQTWNRFDMKPEWPTMMKQLQASGYKTAKVGKTHFYADSPSGSRDLRKNADFLRSFGFDYILEEFDKFIHLNRSITTPYTLYLKEKNLYEIYREETPKLGTPDSNVTDLYTGKTSNLAQEHDLTSFIADRSIDWLKNYQDNKPFFLWISFVAPHAPLIDDPIWAAFYKDVDVPLGPSRRPKIPNNAWGRYIGGWLRGIETENITPQLLTNSIRHYYGMISLIDQRIGDVLKTIDRLGWGNNTWFIFTSDHGEMMGDHGLMFKNVFYKGSVLVPNIIRPPKGMKPRVVNHITQSIDITASIMDIANAEPPDGGRGRSLIPIMRGEGKPREVVFSEMAGHRNRGNFFVMVTTDRYRYLYDSLNKIPCELFDLQEDPDELNNLVEDSGYKSLRKAMHQDYLEPFMEGRIG